MYIAQMRSKGTQHQYIGIRGSVYFHSGGNFQHSNGTVKFYGGYHNIQLGSEQQALDSS